MKKFKKLATLLLTIAIICGVTACLPDLSKLPSSETSGGDSSSIVEENYEYSISLTAFAIDVGQNKTLRVFVEPEKEIEVVWSSADDQIATVTQEGEVTGVAEGVTLITATVDGHTLDCEVTVNALPIVYEYSLDKTSEQLTIGDELQLNVISTPANEQMPIITWSSTANSVATVEGGLVKAVGVGSATITAMVEENALTCEITVDSPVKATATIAERESANITNNHETYDTLYWEHYSGAGERSKLFALKDYVTTNVLDLCASQFGDYKIPLSYNDGTVNLAYERNTNGVHTPGGQDATIEFNVAIDENVKAIRVYVGVWNATNTVTLEWNGVAIATAEAIIAGGDSLAREVTFVIDEIAPEISQLTVKVTASNVNGGNVSAPAIVILGNDVREASDVTLVYNKEEMPSFSGDPSNDYFLTELGTQDWIYLNKHEIERKNGGNMILVDSLEVEGNNSFDDYKGTFSWTDGTINAISSGINNDGQFGSWATVQTKIDALTNHVYFWVGGYSSTYYFEVYDSKGNLLVSELLHEEEGGVTHSYMIDLAVSVAGEETLMLNIYRTGGANCSVAALAVHKEVEYSYSLKQSEIELQAKTTWEKLEVVATPDRRYQVSFQSNNEEIATVDANGVITGVAEGETTVNVLIDGKDVGLTATVKVTPAPIEYTYELTESITLSPGQEHTLEVVITPAPIEAPAVEWSSNYPDIVEVENGKLTAKQDGEATITAVVEGHTLTCVVTVKTAVTATVVTTAENPYEVSLTDNDATLETIYWEHYAGGDTHASRNGEDIITATPAGSYFGDFGIRFVWLDGTDAKRVGNHNREGSHTTGAHVAEAQIAVNQNVKAIRVYAGAWRATNTLSLIYNGMVLATSDSFTADWTSTAREITFNLEVKEAITLTLRVEGSNVEGNVSLNAIVVLGDAQKEAPVASVTLEKTSLIIPEGQRKDINLTQIGDLDWFVPETNLVDGDPYDIDEKKGANYIDSSSFAMSSYNWYGDFGYDRVFFNWSDGTNFPEIGTDRDRNDGRWGAISTVSTKVDASVKHVYLWTSGWNCSYTIAVLDGKGNIIFSEEVVHAQGNNQPFELNFAVNSALEENLTFVLYGTSSDNCSILAMAVSAKADFDYSANISEITLFEQETALFTVTASPVKELFVEYSSNANDVATVDNNGVITAVSAGNAVITALVDGVTLTCNVTVEERPVEYTYTLNANQKELTVNGTFQLEVSVSPSKEFTASFTSQNDGIVEVDANGLITAKADGVVNVDVLVEGFVVATCQITVKTYVTAGEITVANGDGQTVELGNLANGNTLYWERYRDNKEVVAMMNATDLILSNTMVDNGGGFGDYKAQINWINGNSITSWIGNTSGLCFGGQTVVTVKVNPAVKQIVVYTGAWNATVYAQILLGETVIATSETWEAGGSGIARFVTFNLTVKEECTLTLTLNPTSSAGGNASLTAIALMGDKPDTTTSLTLTKEQLPAEFVTVEDKSQPSVSYDLTALGTIDWFYTNFENQGTDEMANGTAIDSSSLKWDGGGKFWDYKAIFTFSNGTKWNTTAGNDKDSDVTYGTNNGVCGAWAQIAINVDQNTQNVHLFVGGYQSTYYVMAIDSNGTMIYHEMLNEGTSAYHLDFAVNATQAEAITFVVYRTTGNNCSIAAVAVA